MDVIAQRVPGRSVSHEQGGHLRRQRLGDALVIVLEQLLEEIVLGGRHLVHDPIPHAIGVSGREREDGGAARAAAPEGGGVVVDVQGVEQADHVAR